MLFDEASFSVKRTVRGLCDYVAEIEKQACADPALKRFANRRQGPFGRYFQELRPFAHYCRVKYGLDSPHLCYLTEIEAGDACVRDPKTGQTRLIEITWPHDPEFMMKLKGPPPEDGIIDFRSFDLADTSLHEAALERVLDIARKKSTRDYSNADGSTLLFVFESATLFWDHIPSHRTLLNALVDKLALIPFRADDVELLLLGNRHELLVVHRQTH